MGSAQNCHIVFRLLTRDRDARAWFALHAGVRQTERDNARTLHSSAIEIIIVILNEKIIRIPFS